MNTPLRSGIFLAPFHAKADIPTLAMERDFELLQHLQYADLNERGRQFADGPGETLRCLKYRHTA